MFLDSFLQLNEVSNSSLHTSEATCFVGSLQMIRSFMSGYLKSQLLGLARKLAIKFTCRTLISGAGFDDVTTPV